MLKDMVDLKYLDGCRLQIHFGDEVEDVVDVAEIVRFSELLSSLEDTGLLGSVSTQTLAPSVDPTALVWIRMRCVL